MARRNKKIKVSRTPDYLILRNKRAGRLFAWILTGIIFTLGMVTGAALGLGVYIAGQ